MSYNSTCAVTGGLEALRKGQMTVFLAGEKARSNFCKHLNDIWSLLWQIFMLCFLVELVDLQPLAEEYMPLMESIYCNVIYTGKMGTALIPKVCKNQTNHCTMGKLVTFACKSNHKVVNFGKLFISQFSSKTWKIWHEAFLTPQKMGNEKN